MWIEGDSTLHKYSAQATTFQISGKADIFLSSGELLKGRLKDLSVTIPVKSLKSGKGGLDKNMYKDLKADTCPVITFKFQNCNCPEIFNAGESIKVKVLGLLNVACKEKPVELEAEVVYTMEGIRVKGEKRLLMTDFGIKPRRFLGFMKVSNEVTVKFDVTLAINNLSK